MVCFIISTQIIFYRTDHPCSNKDAAISFKKMALCKMPQILCIQLVRFKKYFICSQETPSTQEHSVITPTPTLNSTPNPISSTTTEDDTTPPPESNPSPKMLVEKIDTSIEIPTELVLTGLVSHHPVKYGLLAVCNHHGSSPNSGQYTALFLLGGDLML